MKAWAVALLLVVVLNLVVAGGCGSELPWCEDAHHGQRCVRLIDGKVVRLP